MMKKLSQLCLTLIVAVGLAGSFLVATGATATAATKEDLINQAQCEKTENTDCFGDVQSINLNNDCSSSTADCNIVSKYINPAIAFVGILGGIAVTVGIIIGGIEYASSGGDPQKAASGKKHIKAAVIALLGLLFLWAFIRFLMPSGTAG